MLQKTIFPIMPNPFGDHIIVRINDTYKNIGEVVRNTPDTQEFTIGMLVLFITESSMNQNTEQAVYLSSFYFDNMLYAIVEKNKVLATANI